jgi:diphosphate-dependent phosphofructokinase
MDLQLCIVGSVILQSHETYLYTHLYMPLFYLQVQHLIAELNEILAHETVDEGGLWKKKLTDQSLKLFEFLPRSIQEQLMLERDPHGNVQVLNGVMLLCLLC